MKRGTRAAKAKETLAIIEDGFYIQSEQRIIVSDDLQKSIAGSKLYREDEFAEVLESAESKISQLNFTTRLSVVNPTVLDAASKMANREGNIGCLNFASAKNPGGGFLNGAQAQEESLAVSSALYATQMKHFELYEYNRSRPTFLYSDHMIYSPDVVVFRDDDGELLTTPYKLSIITSPATNIGAMKVNRRQELEEVERTMLQRMDKMLALFVHHGITRLLLGAWGCSVFQNNPSDIANWFACYLKGDGKYARCFEEVVFAIYDRSKEEDRIAAFQQKLLSL